MPASRCTERVREPPIDGSLARPADRPAKVRRAEVPLDGRGALGGPLAGFTAAWVATTIEANGEPGSR